MSERRSGGVSGTCPRCRSNTIETRAVSPIAGVWTLFACSTCFYVWRSTEPEENREPDHYPAAFRLEAHGLAQLPIAPAIEAPAANAASST